MPKKTPHPISNSDERLKFRQYFFDAWAKHKLSVPLDDFEEQLLFVMQQYPEYHRMLDNPDQYLRKDYPIDCLDANPFLRMGLHMSLNEQVQHDTPLGIQGLHREFCSVFGNVKLAEQHMIVSMANTLWAAQDEGRLAIDEEYIRDLRLLLQKHQMA